MAPKDKSYKLTLLPGDGIGPEIMAEAVKVLRALEKNFDFHFDMTSAPIGGAAVDLEGLPISEATLAQCRQSDAVLLGAVGGPKWDCLPKEQRPETGLLKLRKSLGLYCNLRPIKLFPALRAASPITALAQVQQSQDQDNPLDMLIVRELTGGIYFGDRGLEDTPQGKSAWDQERYSDFEIERVAQIAFEAAKGRKGLVTSIDKANVLESSRLWRSTVTQVHGDRHEGVELRHQYVDNCAMQLILNPRQFDVLLTSNLFGDILSDEASTLAGSIGLMPSASLGD